MVQNVPSDGVDFVTKAPWYRTYLAMVYKVAQNVPSYGVKIIDNFLLQSIWY
jgi:hypothetical protein